MNNNDTNHKYKNNINHVESHGDGEVVLKNISSDKITSNTNIINDHNIELTKSTNIVIENAVKDSTEENYTSINTDKSIEQQDKIKSRRVLSLNAIAAKPTRNTMKDSTSNNTTNKSNPSNNATSSRSGLRVVVVNKSKTSQMVDSNNLNLDTIESHVDKLTQSERQNRLAAVKKSIRLQASEVVLGRTDPISQPQVEIEQQNIAIPTVTNSHDLVVNTNTTINTSTSTVTDINSSTNDNNNGNINTDVTISNKIDKDANNNSDNDVNNNSLYGTQHHFINKPSKPISNFELNEQIKPISNTNLDKAQEKINSNISYASATSLPPRSSSVQHGTNIANTYNKNEHNLRDTDYDSHNTHNQFIATEPYSSKHNTSNFSHSSKNDSSSSSLSDKSEYKSTGSSGIYNNRHTYSYTKDFIKATPQDNDFINLDNTSEIHSANYNSEHRYQSSYKPKSDTPKKYGSSIRQDTYPSTYPSTNPRYNTSTNNRKPISTPFIEYRSKIKPSHYWELQSSIKIKEPHDADLTTDNKSKIRNLDQLYKKPKPQPIIVENIKVQENLSNTNTNATIPLGSSIAATTATTTNTKTAQTNSKTEYTQHKKFNQSVSKNSTTNKNKNTKFATTTENVSASKNESSLTEHNKFKKTVKKLYSDDTARKFSHSNQFKRRSSNEFDEDDISSGYYGKNSGKFSKKKIINVSQYQRLTKDVIVPNTITVQELASRMSEKASNVIKSLIKLGVMATITESIDADIAEIIVTEFGHKCIRDNEHMRIDKIVDDVDEEEVNLQFRAPIVTVMGHVDHGKTSLLDALRSTDIATKEFGGITQQIGAYKVHLTNGKSITFLDTPGHQAFTAMRTRGAKVTDIVVLVVAADDGIKAQTIEAINHAKIANVPIVVAINKIDKHDADIQCVKNALLSHNVISDDMGGDTMVVPVSAKCKIGLEKLEEVILLQSELLNLRANPNRRARGYVIEAKMDKTTGPIATFLVQKGTLKSGDIVVAGTSYGRIRMLIDDKGKKVANADPSTPVEVFGLNDTPIAGDEFLVVEDEKIAKDVVEFRLNEAKETKSKKVMTKQCVTNLFVNALSKKKELSILVKADTHGSVEAIVQSILRLSVKDDEVQLKIIHYGVGGINESDIALAATSKAIIVGFNIRAFKGAKDMASITGVEIRYYSIIYDLIDDIQLIAHGMLDPILRENVIGNAEIRKVFDVSKHGKIAGCYVLNGIIKRNAKVRLLRDNILIHEGKLQSLKRQKDDVKEVKFGFECGIALEKYDDIREKDMLEIYEIIEEQQKLKMESSR